VAIGKTRIPGPRNNGAICSDIHRHAETLGDHPTRGLEERSWRNENPRKFYQIHQINSQNNNKCVYIYRA
jgi:hypothetical protein